MPGRIAARVQSDRIAGSGVAEDGSTAKSQPTANAREVTNERETSDGNSDAQHAPHDSLHTSHDGQHARHDSLHASHNAQNASHNVQNASHDVFRSISSLLPRGARDLLERFRRSQAIGAAPSLIAYAILQLQLTPSMEAAADFAADRVGGRLGASLKRHRLAEPTGRRAFDAFAADWHDLDSSLQRAVSLMGAAVDAPPDSRDRILERALDTALTGARDRVSTFATEVRGPAMAIYAFGVMMPLALVGMLPVVTSTGSSVSIVLLAAVYDVILPAFLLVGSAWLVVKRPAVAASSFRTEHLEFETPLWQAVGVGLVIAAAVAIGAPLVVPAW